MRILKSYPLLKLSFLSTVITKNFYRIIEIFFLSIFLNILLIISLLLYENRDKELFGEKEYSKTGNKTELNHKANQSYNGLLSPNRFDQSNSGIRSMSTLRIISSATNTINNNSIVTEFLKEKELKTIYIYENIGESFTRKKILEETRGLSGIYLILNKVTKDYYVGSASTNKFHVRFANHLINLTGSKVVKAAVRKYKLSEFVFMILELFPEIVTKENNKKLLDLEDFYLKSLLPNYNILTEAGSSFGYKHTEISRLKMKNQYSLERRERIGSLNRGKSLSVETKDKIRISKKALTKEKPNYSEQAILNMKKNSKPIILYNLNKTVYGEFTSIVEAAKSIGCNEKTIRRALKTKKNFLKRR